MYTNMIHIGRGSPSKYRVGARGGSHGGFPRAGILLEVFESEGALRKAHGCRIIKRNQRIPMDATPRNPWLIRDIPRSARGP
jgi:hypothetical protein